MNEKNLPGWDDRLSELRHKYPYLEISGKKLEESRKYLSDALNTETGGWHKFLRSLKSLRLEKNISVDEARRNYFLQKTFSKECWTKEGDDFKLVLDKDFKEYIKNSSTENLQDFVEIVLRGLDIIADRIISVSEYWEDAPTDSEIAPFAVWNKLLRYVAKERKDVKVQVLDEIKWPRTHVKV